MSTKMTLVHREYLPSVRGTYLPKFRKVYVGKQNRQSRNLLISAKLVPAFSENTSCEMQQVTNPPSKEDDAV